MRSICRTVEGDVAQIPRFPLLKVEKVETADNLQGLLQGAEEIGVLKVCRSRSLPVIAAQRWR